MEDETGRIGVGIDDDFPKLLEPGGDKQIWELGMEKNWPGLGTLLKNSGVESLWAVDPGSERRLANVRRHFDESRDANSNNIVHHLTGPKGGDSGHKLLKRLLALGVDPDLPGYCPGVKARPSHLVSCFLRPKCAQAIFLCRPNLSAVTSSDGLTLLHLVRNTITIGTDNPMTLCSDTPLSAAQSDDVLGKDPRRKLIAEIWGTKKNRGFPTIARLAYQKEFWAVQNLCRRGVIKGSEILEPHKEMNVFQWTEHHGKLKLVQELRYLLNQPSIMDNLIKDVRLLTARVNEFEKKLDLCLQKLQAAFTKTSNELRAVQSGNEIQSMQSREE